MAAVGLRLAHRRIGCKPPPPGLAPRLVRCEEVGKVDRPHPRPDAAGAAEVGNARFRADPRAGEDDTIRRASSIIRRSSATSGSIVLLHSPACVHQRACAGCNSVAAPHAVRGTSRNEKRPRNALPCRKQLSARPASRPAWLIDSADFWRLWFVGLVVFVVRWVETVAVGVFVYQHTGSAFIVAMMTMLRLLPMGLFGAFLGAIAERMERRTTLIVVVASMVATSLTLATAGAPAPARGLAPRGRQLHQRHRLGDRQSGAAGDDRRGGRRRADGHRDVGRCRRQQRQPHGGADDRRPAARRRRHRRRVHVERGAVRDRRGGGVPRALSQQLSADHSGIRARAHRRGLAAGARRPAADRHADRHSDLQRVRLAVHQHGAGDRPGPAAARTRGHRHPGQHGRHRRVRRRGADGDVLPPALLPRTPMSAA